MTTETKTERTLTLESLPELVRDLLIAQAAGQLRAADTDDGGSCNFDSPVLAVETKGERRLAAVAAELAGGDSYDWKWGRRVVGRVLSFRSPGQGNQRSRFAEAAAKYLESQGWPTSVYYQCD